MFYLNDLPGYICPLSCSGTRDTLCLCISADNFSFMLEDISSLAGLVFRGGRVERKRKRKEKEREAGEKGFRSNISSYKIRLLPPFPPPLDRPQARHLIFVGKRWTRASIRCYPCRDSFCNNTVFHSPVSIVIERTAFKVEEGEIQGERLPNRELNDTRTTLPKHRGANRRH